MMTDFSEVDGLSPDAIRVEVARIVDSELFRSSQMLRNLLTYFVEVRLSDASESLKEDTLVTQPLNQPPTFDPRVNNIVSVHAHQLRQRLHDYYAQEGNASVLIVDLPKARYVPHFMVAPDSSRSELNKKREAGESSVSQIEVLFMCDSRERLS